jgi:hypothetical protein
MFFICLPYWWNLHRIALATRHRPHHWHREATVSARQESHRHSPMPDIPPTRPLVRGGLTDEQRLYLINHAVQRASRGHLGAHRLVAEMRVAIPSVQPLLDHLAAQPLEMKNPFNVDTLVMQQFFET